MNNCENKIMFLSSEWFELIDVLYEKHKAPIPEKFIGQCINFVVSDTPNGVCEFSINDGRYTRGFSESPKATVKVDYKTAHTILVEQNVSAGMMALMTGKLKVDGSLAAVLMLKEAQDIPEFKQISKTVSARTIIS